MKNKITVAGIGPGSFDYISPAALKKIQSAKILIGSQRALSYFATDNQISCKITGDISTTIKFIRENILIDDVVVMASGDPGYYSILDTLRKEFSTTEIEVIPSISSMQLAFAKLSMSWYNAALLSFHGRKPSEEKLKYEPNKIIGMLTDGENNSHTIADILKKNGWRDETKITVCARLSYEDEKIFTTTLDEIKNYEIFKHCILIVRE